MLAGQFCVRECPSIHHDDSIRVAAERMVTARADLLVVVDEALHPIGLLTGRDLILEVMGGGHGAAATVETLLDDEPPTILESTSLGFALARMYELSAQHMLVVQEDGQLVGVLHRDDALGRLGRSSAGLRA